MIQMGRDPDATKERYEGDTQERSWDANVKRTYDEFQQESLETIRQHRTLFDKLLTDAQQYDNQRQVIANLALGNAVDTANLVNKQAAAHRDIAINKEWNLEPSEAAAESQVLPAFWMDLVMAIAVAVSTEMKKEG